MYRLITFCLLLLIGSVALAQEEETLIPVPVNIVDARLNLLADGSYSLWLTGSLGTGCQTPVEVTERVYQTTLEIEIFQSISPAVMCPLLLIEYEDTLEFDAPMGVLRVVIGDLTFDLPGAQAIPDEIRDKRQVETIIEAVTLTGDELLIEGYHPDGCQADTQIDLLPLAVDWLNIMIYRYVPQGVACTLNIIPFEHTLSLTGLMFDEETALDLALLEINDLSYFVDDAQLLPAHRDYPFIEGRSLYNEFAPVRLEVIGTFEDSCDDPIRAYISERQVTGIFDVYIYRVIETDALRECQPILRTVTTPINFPADLENGLYRYDVNDGALTGAFVAPEVSFTAQIEALSNRVPHVIDLVTTAIDSDGHLWVNVLGYIPDGCETAVSVDIVTEDGMIDIAVYRQIPPGVMCPQAFIPYSDVFDLGILPAGDYVVTVNNATDQISVP